MLARISIWEFSKLGISKAADYAILTVAYLSSSTQGVTNRIMSKSRLVRSLNLPREFLSQILQKLTRARILVSHRGVKGGYGLRKPPHETTMREVIEAIDGPSKLVECLAEDFRNCGRLHICSPLIQKMARVQSEIDRVLDSVHFDEIEISSPEES